MADLSDFTNRFCLKFSDQNSCDVDKMWTELKGKILDSIDNYIPSETISSSKHQAQWINSKLNRELTNYLIFIFNIHCIYVYFIVFYGQSVIPK